MSVAVCEASPSLALLKYWGKQSAADNLPATPSLAVGLGGLTTTTRVRLADGPDRVVVDGEGQPPARYEPFFDAVRRELGASARFFAESTNSFPTAAGLASSSSGFAALAHACARAAGAELGLERISELARIGSASAARAVYGGFTLLPAGGRSARRLFAADHWPDLRILIAVVAERRKELSSREAMEHSRGSSPFYPAWLEASGAELPQAIDALQRRDLEALGESMRRSYLRMFATMLGCAQPILYWLPESVAIIRACAELRAAGIGVWETMDAGPQVKLLCGASELARVTPRILELKAATRLIKAHPAPEPRVWSEEG